MSKIVIFTDGAAKGNPGPGGWGVVILSGSGSQAMVTELGGKEAKTTNNRMEMTAISEALREVGRGQDIVIYTDSKYVINGVTKWRFAWQKNGWQTKDKKDVLNTDLWQKILTQVDENKITWQYVPGHSGITGNERVDEIASTFASGGFVELYHGPWDKYTLSETIGNLAIDKKAAEQKAKNKSGKSGKAYSYVSQVDGEIQTHQTWAECEARVKGVKARFRKALSPTEEQELINLFQTEYEQKRRGSSAKIILD